MQRCPCSYSHLRHSLTPSPLGERVGVRGSVSPSYTSPSFFSLERMAPGLRPNSAAIVSTLSPA